MHTVIGVFHKNDSRSYYLLKDLTVMFGEETRFFIVWDEYTTDSSYLFSRFAHLRQITKTQLFDEMESLYSVDKSVLISYCNEYKPLLKILLALCVRKKFGVEYSIMTDNDVFIFEPIEEIVRLSELRVPFLVQETGANDQLPLINNYIVHTLCRQICYISPNKGKGYNIGFCGMDLTVLDDIDAFKFSLLLKIMSGCPEWWKDQAFFVSMIFTSQKPVYTFERERYMFLPYDNMLYRRKSKIYHCIYTADKRNVDWYYLMRYGKWFEKTMVFFLGLFPQKSKAVVKSVRGKVRLRTRIYNFFKLPDSGKVIINANRYRHIINYVKKNNCNRILEIGVYKGDTSEALIRKSRNPNVEYHGIDVFENNSSLLEKEVSLIPDSMEKVQEKLMRYSKKIFLYKGLSKKVYLDLVRANLTFDLIWIDGGHSYETVKSDFEQYSKLLATGGIIFFADYTEDPHLPDVKKYIDKEILPNKRFEVKVYEKNIDKYRGYTYKVVSVRIKKKTIFEKN